MWSPIVQSLKKFDDEIKGGTMNATSYFVCPQCLEIIEIYTIYHLESEIGLCESNTFKKCPNCDFEIEEYVKKCNSKIIKKIKQRYCNE